MASEAESATGNVSDDDLEAADLAASYAVHILDGRTVDVLGCAVALLADYYMRQLIDAGKTASYASGACKGLLAHVILHFEDKHIYGGAKDGH